MSEQTPNYVVSGQYPRMVRIFREMRRFAMKGKNITVAEYDERIKAQVDEAIGESFLAAVPQRQSHE